MQGRRPSLYPLIGWPMTKRARVSAATGVRINERELEILKRVGSSGGPCVLGIAALSRDFSCSVATTRNAVRALEGKGLVSVRARYLRNGGQLENEYELTAEGERILEADASLA